MITIATCEHELSPQLATVEAFIRRNVPFNVSGYRRDKTAQALSNEHKYSQFPVVYCTDLDGNVFHSWHGYDPEQVAQAAEGRFYE